MSAARRLTAALAGQGKLRLLEQPVPKAEPGQVLLRVHRSLISPGSELGGWRAMSERRKANGSLGEAEPKPFGYSNAGIVEEADSATGFKPGDRVAAIGHGYALHSTHALVPHNLCARLPDDVSFEQGSYAMLLATAMHGLRRTAPQLGEYVAVAGLGILGQLTARLFQIAGCYVAGWDPIAARRELAEGFGVGRAFGAEDEDVVAATRAFTDGDGLDAAVLAHNGPGDTTMERVVRSMKCTRDGHPCGVVTVLGHVTFAFTTRPMSNIDIRMAFRTGAGYHDKQWERGDDYPPVYMRWTTRSNLELCLRLLAEGRVDVRRLTTHRVRLVDAENAFDELLAHPDRVLGVVFEMEDMAGTS